MALVDGQLAPADVPSLVQELARNSALVAELQEYLTMSRSRIAQAYSGKVDEPTPRRLIDAVMQAPMRSAPPRRQKSHVRLLDWLRRSYRVPAWSLAAGSTAVAAAALAATLVILPLDSSGLLRLDMGRDLGATLERTASGKDAALATVRPMLSFRSKTDGWCRQFELRNAGRQLSHALACRGQSGDWEVVAATPPATAGGYMPAGADRRKVIDDLATSMMQGQPLSPESEAAAIGRGWRQL